MESVITFEKVNKHFGGIHALRDVSFSIARGEICALMGENGAGKSTLAKVLFGVIQPDSGTMLFEGNHHAPKSPLDSQRDGISIIFQELDLFPNQTVAQNLVVENLKLMPAQGGFVSDRKLARITRPWLEKVGLSVEPNTPLNQLAIAQIQLVAIARALSMESKLIVMDEPTSALSSSAAEHLFELVLKLKRDGVTIIYISHKMDEIFRIADSIAVMRDGAYIGTKRRTETNLDEIVAMMVGRTVEFRNRQASWRKERVVLAFESVRTRLLKDISFELHEGEVLGVAGLVGCGSAELGKALFGLDALTLGSITINNRRVTRNSPQLSIRRRVGLIPGDRKLEGLFMQQSVSDNVSITVADKNQTLGFIRKKGVEGLVNKTFEATKIKAAHPGVCINTLSGGNQQKALVGRWLLADSSILFLDDPTRGVDIVAKQDIYKIINELVKEGRSVIFVSSELTELLGCTDRILVLYRGAAAGILNTSETSQEEIIRYAMGLNLSETEHRGAR